MADDQIQGLSSMFPDVPFDDGDGKDKKDELYDFDIDNAADILASGFGLNVTSTSRTPEKNREVGGSDTSFHLVGLGADLSGSPEAMREFADFASQHVGSDSIFAEVIHNDTDHADHVHVAFNKGVSADLAKLVAVGRTDFFSADFLNNTNGIALSSDLLSDSKEAARTGAAEAFRQYRDNYREKRNQAKLEEALEVVGETTDEQKIIGLDFDPIVKNIVDNEREANVDVKPYKHDPNFVNVEAEEAKKGEEADPKEEKEEDEKPVRNRGFLAFADPNFLKSDQDVEMDGLYAISQGLGPDGEPLSLEARERLLNTDTPDDSPLTSLKQEVEEEARMDEIADGFVQLVTATPEEAITALLNDPLIQNDAVALNQVRAMQRLKEEQRILEERGIVGDVAAPILRGGLAAVQGFSVVGGVSEQASLDRRIKMIETFGVDRDPAFQGRGELGIQLPYLKKMNEEERLAAIAELQESKERSYTSTASNILKVQKQLHLIPENKSATALTEAWMNDGDIDPMTFVLGLANLSAEALTQSAPALLTSVAGASVGGPAGAGIGAFTAAATVEYPASFLEYLETEGTDKIVNDLNDEETVKRILRDEKLLVDASAYAATRAMVVGGVEGGVAFGVGMVAANRFLRTLSPMKRAGILGAEIAGDMVGEGAGEYGGSLMTSILNQGGNPDVKAATLEALAAAPTSLLQVIGITGATRARLRAVRGIEKSPVVNKLVNDYIGQKLTHQEFLEYQEALQGLSSREMKQIRDNLQGNKKTSRRNSRQLIEMNAALAKRTAYVNESQVSQVPVTDFQEFYATVNETPVEDGDRILKVRGNDGSVSTFIGNEVDEYLKDKAAPLPTPEQVPSNQEVISSRERARNLLLDDGLSNEEAEALLSGESVPRNVPLRDETQEAVADYQTVVQNLQETQTEETQEDLARGDIPGGAALEDRRTRVKQAMLDEGVSEEVAEEFTTRDDITSVDQLPEGLSADTQRQVAEFATILNSISQIREVETQQTQGELGLEAPAQEVAETEAEPIDVDADGEGAAAIQGAVDAIEDFKKVISPETKAVAEVKGVKVDETLPKASVERLREYNSRELQRGEKSARTRLRNKLVKILTDQGKSQEEAEAAVDLAGTPEVPLQSEVSERQFTDSEIADMVDDAFVDRIAPAVPDLGQITEVADAEALLAALNEKAVKDEEKQVVQRVQQHLDGLKVEKERVLDEAIPLESIVNQEAKPTEQPTGRSTTPPQDVSDAPSEILVNFQSDGFGADGSVGNLLTPNGSWEMKMAPSAFVNLAGEEVDTNNEFIERRIADGEPVAPPSVRVKWDSDRASWVVVKADGIKRANAIKSVAGEINIPVRVFFENESGNLYRGGMKPISTKFNAVKRRAQIRNVETEFGMNTGMQMDKEGRRVIRIIQVPEDQLEIQRRRPRRIVGEVQPFIAQLFEDGRVVNAAGGQTREEALAKLDRVGTMRISDVPIVETPVDDAEFMGALEVALQEQGKGIDDIRGSMTGADDMIAEFRELQLPPGVIANLLIEEIATQMGEQTEDLAAPVANRVEKMKEPADDAPLEVAPEIVEDIIDNFIDPIISTADNADQRKVKDGSLVTSSTTQLGRPDRLKLHSMLLEAHEQGAVEMVANSENEWVFTVGDMSYMVEFLDVEKRRQVSVVAIDKALPNAQKRSQGKTGFDEDTAQDVPVYSTSAEEIKRTERLSKSAPVVDVDVSQEDVETVDDSAAEYEKTRFVESGWITNMILDSDIERDEDGTITRSFDGEVNSRKYNILIKELRDITGNDEALNFTFTAADQEYNFRFKADGRTVSMRVIDRTVADAANETRSNRVMMGDAYITFEAVPGRTTGILPGVHSAPFGARRSYTEKIFGALHENGENVILQEEGLQTLSVVRSLGQYKGDVNPLIVIPIPTEVEAGKPMPKKVRNQIERAILKTGIVVKQDAMAFIRPIEVQEDGQGDIVLYGGGAIDDETALELQSELTARGLINVDGKDDRVVLFATESGFGILSLDFEEGQLFNEQLVSTIDEIVGVTFGEEQQHMLAQNDGGYFENNWTENPNGEEYLSELRKRRGSFTDKDRSRQALQEVAAINQEFSESQGWGIAESSKPDALVLDPSEQTATSENRPTAVTALRAARKALASIFGQKVSERVVKSDLRAADYQTILKKAKAAVAANAKIKGVNVQVIEAYVNLKQDLNEIMAYIQDDLQIDIEAWQDGTSVPYMGLTAQATEDVVEQNHLFYFPTDLIYGDEFNNLFHPMFEVSDFTDVKGRKLTYSDVLVVATQIFGHISEGHEDTFSGAENAWVALHQMVRPESRGALATEILLPLAGLLNTKEKREASAAIDTEYVKLYGSENVADNLTTINELSMGIDPVELDGILAFEPEFAEQMFAKAAPEVVNEIRAEQVEQRKDKLIVGSVLEALNLLTETQQDERHHPEGDVRRHTALTVGQLIMWAASKEFDVTDDVLWAALFHDFGKADTTAINEKNGRLSAHGHEKVSVKYLDQVELPEGVDVGKVRWLIENHMRYKVLDEMTKKKADKLRNHKWFGELQLLGRADQALNLWNRTNDEQRADMEVAFESWLIESGAADLGMGDTKSGVTGRKKSKRDRKRDDDDERDLLDGMNRLGFNPFLDIMQTVKFFRWLVSKGDLHRGDVEAVVNEAVETFGAALRKGQEDKFTTTVRDLYERVGRGALLIKDKPVAVMNLNVDKVTTLTPEEKKASLTKKINPKNSLANFEKLNKIHDKWRKPYRVQDPEAIYNKMVDSHASDIEAIQKGHPLQDRVLNEFVEGIVQVREQVEELTAATGDLDLEIGEGQEYGVPQTLNPYDTGRGFLLPDGKIIWLPLIHDEAINLALSADTYKALEESESMSEKVDIFPYGGGEYRFLVPAFLDVTGAIQFSALESRMFQARPGEPFSIGGEPQIQVTFGAARMTEAQRLTLINYARKSDASMSFDYTVANPVGGANLFSFGPLMGANFSLSGIDLNAREFRQVLNKSMMAHIEDVARREAEKQSLNTDNEHHAFDSEEAFTRFMLDVVGDPADIVKPAYGAIRRVNDPQVFKDELNALSKDQLEMSMEGIRTAKEIRQGFINGDYTTHNLFEFFLWGMLSRRIGPYQQEGAFMRVMLDKASLWIDRAVAGQFTEEDEVAYLDWTERVFPTGDTEVGSAALFSLRDFGRYFLPKMSTPIEEGRFAGRMPIEVLLDLWSDPDTTARDIRRTFYEIVQSPGIDLKVVSFVALVTGFNDAFVLDRIQTNALWDGDLRQDEFGTSKPYSGYRIIRKPGGREEEKGLANYLSGGSGLALYEAVEEAYEPHVREALMSIGIDEEFANVGTYHWLSWVLHSNQEVGHQTLQAMGEQDFDMVGARDGDFERWTYGHAYTNVHGKFKFVVQDSSGSERIMDDVDRENLTSGLNTMTSLVDPYMVRRNGRWSVVSTSELRMLSDREQEGAQPVEELLGGRPVPKGFLISQEEDGTARKGAWWTDERVNREAYSKYVQKFGREATQDESAQIAHRTHGSRPTHAPNGFERGDRSRSSEGIVFNSAEDREARGRLLGGRARSEKSVTLVHYGTSEDIIDLDPATTDLSAAEEAEARRNGRAPVPLTFFYDGGVAEHEDVSNAKRKYVVHLSPATRIYDLAADTDGIVERFVQRNGSDKNALFREVRDAGYVGFKNSSTDQPNLVAMFDRVIPYSVHEMTQRDYSEVFVDELRPEDQSQDLLTKTPATLATKKRAIEETGKIKRQRQIKEDLATLARAGNVLNSNPFGNPAEWKALLRLAANLVIEGADNVIKFEKALVKELRKNAKAEGLNETQIKQQEEEARRHRDLLFEPAVRIASQVNETRREEQLNNEASRTLKERRFGERFKDDQRISEEIREALETAYIPITNEDTILKLMDMIRPLGGVEEVLRFAGNAVSTEGSISKALSKLRKESNVNFVRNEATENLTFAERVGLGMIAMLQAQKEVNSLRESGEDASMKRADAIEELQLEVAEQLSTFGTRLGRGVQAFAMWAYLSPEGVIKRVEKMASESNRKAKEKNSNKDGKLKKAIQTADAEVAEAVGTEAAEEYTSGLRTQLAKDRETRGKKRKVSDIFVNRILPHAKKTGNNPAFDMATILYNIALERGLVVKNPIEPDPNADAKTLAQAIRQFEDNKEAWAEAKERIEEIYSKDPEGMMALNKFLESVLEKPTSDKLLDKNINRALKELELTIADVAKMNWKSVAAAKRGIVQNIIDKTGLSRDEAREVSALIKRRFNKRIREAREKILDQRLASYHNSLKNDPKKREWIDEVYELANLGAFDDAKYDDLLNKLYDVDEVKLTKEERNEIKELANLAQGSNSGFLKAILGSEIATIVARRNAEGWAEIGLSYWYANVLSGIGTQIVNFFGTFQNVFFRSLALAIRTHDRRAFGAWLNGLNEGRKEGFQILKAALQGRDVLFLRGREQNKFMMPNALEVLSRDANAPAPARAAAIAGRYVGRMLSGVDAFWFTTAKEGRAYLLAAEESIDFEKRAKAGNIGNVDEEAKLWQRRMMNNLYRTDEKVDAARAQAELEFRTARQKLQGMRVSEEFDENSLAIRVMEILESKRSDEIREESVKFANKMVFTNVPEGSMGAIAEGLTFFAENILAFDTKFGRVKPMRFFIPFIPILANVADRVLQFSPYGMIRSLRHTGHIGSYNVDPITDEESIERRIEALMGITGMGIIAALGLWALADYDPDDDDEPFFTISGAGPTNYQHKRQWLSQGGRPWSIRINGVNVPYNETNFAIAFGMIGNFFDQLRWGENPYEYGTDILENKDLIEKFGMGMLSMPRIILDSTLLSSAGDIVKAMESPEHRLSKTLTRPASGFLPAIGLMRDFSTFFQPGYTETSNVFGEVIKDYPVLKFLDAAGNRKMLNALGEEIPGNGWLADKILPGKQGATPARRLFTVADPGPVWEFLARERLWIPMPRGDVSIVPPNAKLYENVMIDKMIRVGHISDMSMTDEELWRFTRIRGIGMKVMLEQVVDNAFFNRLSREEKQKRIQRMATQMDSYVKRQLLNLPAVPPIITNSLLDPSIQNPLDDQFSDEKFQELIDALADYD